MPSAPVFTRVRFSQELPPVTLYEIRIGAPAIAVPLSDKLPVISTLKPLAVVVLLQKALIVDVAFGVGVGVGEGVGVGVGVGVGIGVDVGVGVGVGVDVGVGVGVGIGVGDDRTPPLIITQVSESSIEM